MGCCISISQSEVGVLETCGKFSGIAGPGFHCVLPWTSVRGAVSMRLNEHETYIESKTKDNTFVRIRLVLQHQVIADRAKEAFYSVSNPVQAMENYVLNAIRAAIPQYKFDALYLERGMLSAQLKDMVDREMAGYGIEITSALIADIDPGPSITEAMNDIQKLQRLRVAAVNEAETEKLIRVKAAEADAEARKLSGEGIAEQRKAIVAGLRNSIQDINNDMSGVTNDDASNMLMMNQYYDTLEAIAENCKDTVLILETAGGIEKVALQAKRGLLEQMR